MKKDFLKEHPFLYITIALLASAVGYYLFELIG